MTRRRIIASVILLAAVVVAVLAAPALWFAWAYDEEKSYRTGYIRTLRNDVIYR